MSKGAFKMSDIPGYCFPTPSDLPVADKEAVMAQDRQYVMSTYGRMPVVFVRGEGVWIWDSEGKAYLDFLAGIAVNGLGHCHPEVVAAIREQAGILIHTSNLYYTLPQPRLAELLVQHSACDRVFFANSGAEANECAIKLARKWAKLHYGEQRFEIIVLEGSFHGRTLATITATGQPKYQKGFEPLMPGFSHIPFNEIQALKGAITQNTCALMLEPIQGESGVRPLSEVFLRTARALCDEHGLLLILDEVQTGMGRTGKLFAYEHYGIEPEIVTLAKSLGGGIPIGACLAKEHVASVFQPGDHASTFGGTPLACAAAHAALSTILEEDLIGNAARQGNYFQQQLCSLKDRGAPIAEVRGKGLMVGVDLTVPKARDVLNACLERGLILNAIGDCTLRFLPPLIVTQEHIDQAISILARVLSEL